jgi:hypothetical protein
MAQFMGDVAFLLELALVAAGLVLLHAGLERSAGAGRAGFLRAAGWILVVGATATALCTGYFWVRYHRAGDFDRAGTCARVEERTLSLDSLDITPRV